MVIDSKSYSGLCTCGRHHEMATREAVILPGCLKDFAFYTEKQGLTGRFAAIYDENTYRAANGVRPCVDQEIILPARGLHADERAVELVLGQLREDVDCLVAVGSGTIHDTTRYCAYQRGIPFVACPTAASVDGFCSTICAMTWKGFKKTMPGKAPVLVLADTDIIQKAPLRLTLSGAGDIFGKYTALADWKIAHILTGEYICPRIEAMTREAVDALRQCCGGLAQGDPAAVSQLTYALILSGLAMQMMGNSRPASGCEHHISHLIEMEPEAFDFECHGLHGEKVGVGTVLASEEFHRLADMKDISSWVRDYAFPDIEDIHGFYGDRLWQATMDENRDDCMAGVTKERLISAWPEICGVIREIPDPESLRALYREAGIKASLDELEIPEEYRTMLLKYSPSARNRLTMMRVRWMFSV